ncbi:Uncharacterised protein [Klebsiella pneumoniae]|uniref:Uncharacterized protein n=1 Tax=Klebsiella pneumoniae TaxID=573 RepID=A0A377VFI6_KLEPN|nr:Uncharacterised protein [Klebsiella pneumoniae]
MASTPWLFFSDDWLADGHDHINPFLGVAFEGKVPAQYEQENGRFLSVAIGNHQEAGKLSSRLFPCLCPCRSTERGCGPNWTGDVLPSWARTNSSAAARWASRRYARTTSSKRRANPGRTKTQQHLGDWYPAELEGCRRQMHRGHRSGQSLLPQIGRAVL